MPLILMLLAASGLALALTFGTAKGRHAVDRQRLMAEGKRDPNLTLSYARKWGPVFGAPTQILMTLAHNESGHNPFMRDPSASGKGGAWGLMAQMADEAGSKVKRILGTWGHLPEVRATAKKWTGKPEDLWDPDLNMMISSWQVGRLVRKFGPRIDVVAAGYHQGEGAVGRRIAAGKPAIDPKLQPKGAVYVARAEKVMPLYQGVA